MNAPIQRFSVITGFSLLVLLLIGNAVVTRRRISVLVENQRCVAHTQQVRYLLAQTELLATDAETGQRGYLFTGEPKYLKPYQDAIAAVGSRIEDLARLTADNPRQQQHVGTLRNLAHQKLDELAETISLCRAGNPSAARSVVLSDRGLMLMNHIREEIEQMQQEEASLEAVRNTAYERSIEIAILGMVVLANFILRERRVRELIEDDGPGVAPELLDRIFDPFFTTKQDVGTGLGLWVAKEIVGRHGGSIRVRPAGASDGLKGAAFVIRLPCAGSDQMQTSTSIHE